MRQPTKRGIDGHGEAVQPALMRIMTTKYGFKDTPRVEKLLEEIDELREAALRLKDVSAERWAVIVDPDKPMQEFDRLENHYIDELADVTAIVTHLQHLAGYRPNYLLALAKDKILKREKDPNYKREHICKSLDLL